MELTTLTVAEFTEFERRQSTGNFFQTAARAELRQRMGYHTHLLGVKRHGKVVVAALVVERYGEAWIQLGPIMDYRDLDLLDFFLRRVKSYAIKQKFVKLEIFPPVLLSTRAVDGSVLKQYDREAIFGIFAMLGYRHEGFGTKIENKAVRWMFAKDLSGIQTLRDAELTMNASTRKKLHKAQRELEVRVLKSPDELAEWREALVESNRRNGLPTRPLEYFEWLWGVFGEDAAFVEARVKGSGELVASELDIYHPNELVAFLAGSIEQQKHHNGSVAIKGWNIEECLRRGLTRLNLYGMEGEFSPQNPLLYFKSGLGGYVEEYVGGFALSLHPVRGAAGKAWRKVTRAGRRK